MRCAVSTARRTAPTTAVAGLACCYRESPRLTEGAARTPFSSETSSGGSLNKLHRCRWDGAVAVGQVKLRSGGTRVALMQTQRPVHSDHY